MRRLHDGRDRYKLGICTERFQAYVINYFIYIQGVIPLSDGWRMSCSGPLVFRFIAMEVDATALCLVIVSRPGFDW